MSHLSITLEIGFVILNSMLRTTSTIFYWVIRLIWMKAKGLSLPQRAKLLLMNMISNSLRLSSAKTNLNVEEVFFSIARDIKQRLADTDSKAEPQAIKINKPDQAAGGAATTQKSACCGS